MTTKSQQVETNRKARDLAAETLRDLPAHLVGTETQADWIDELRFRNRELQRLGAIPAGLGA